MVYTHYVCGKIGRHFFIAPGRVCVANALLDRAKENDESVRRRVAPIFFALVIFISSSCSTINLNGGLVAKLMAPVSRMCLHGAILVSALARVRLCFPSSPVEIIPEHIRVLLGCVQPRSSLFTPPETLTISAICNVLVNRAARLRCWLFLEIFSGEHLGIETCLGASPPTGIYVTRQASRKTNKQNSDRVATDDVPEMTFAKSASNARINRDWAPFRNCLSDTGYTHHFVFIRS